MGSLAQSRRKEAIDLVENAVAGETSPHVQNDVLQCAACLALPRLPPSVVKLVTEEFNAQPNTDTGPFIARIGADGPCPKLGHAGGI